MSKFITNLDTELRLVQKKRDKALRTFRLRCKHLKLAEVDYRPSSFGAATPPYRICMDCAATERGWHCGYQILTLQVECSGSAPPRKILWHGTDRSELDVLKMDWPAYFVGQSHNNFSEHFDYKSLTAIPEIK